MVTACLRANLCLLALMGCLGAQGPLLPRPVLAMLENASGRRLLLQRITTHYLRTAPRTDLDTLCHVVAWDARFLKHLPTRRARIGALTEDLVLLFTERAPDGIRLSESDLYRPGRFTDTGFRPDLRDGSDQVRHLAWALRICFISRTPAQGEALLRLKEIADARLSDQPLNQADLALNHAARQILESPLSLHDWPSLFRKHL